MGRHEGRANEMTAAANTKYRYNVGYDYCLADGYDPEYLDDAAGNPGEDEEAARQALNQAMSDWFGM